MIKFTEKLGGVEVTTEADDFQEFMLFYSIQCNDEEKKQEIYDLLKKLYGGAKE